MNDLSGSINKRRGAQHGREEEGCQEGHEEEEEEQVFRQNPALFIANRSQPRWISGPRLGGPR
jgi:hypothetical protein